MKKVDVIIVGAGASGLYLAHKLLKQNIDFLILDKSKTFGGVIQEATFQDHKVPMGPRVFLAKRSRVLQELAREFQEPFLHHTKSLKRYLLSKKGLTPLAMSIFLKKPLGLLKYLILKPLSVEQTIKDYFLSFFDQDFIDEIIDPMSFGIWAAEPANLSMDVLMSDMKYKKIFSKKGPSGLVAFPNGLKALFGKIQKTLKDHLMSSVEVTGYNKAPDGIYVHTNSGKFLTQKLVCATSFYDMQKLVEDPVLEGLQSSSIDVVTFCFEQIQDRVHGSGYLIPTKRGFKTKGVLFDSDLLGYKTLDMLSCFIQNSSDPLNDAYEELKQVLPNIKAYSKAFVTSYKDSIFQCSVGAEAQVTALEKKLKQDHIYLLGAYPKVGLYDCLQKASDLADTLTSSLTCRLGNES